MLVSKINETMMQYFEWYLPPDCKLWEKVRTQASYLETIGITSIWLPPAYKCIGGKNDTGYAVYDLYDLGEFNQKGSIETKYGTKQEYIDAIKTLKGNGLSVIADIVFNHRMGADDKEEVMATEEMGNNRNVDISEPKLIEAWTKYNFDARNNMYSDFKWNWTHFHGTDWDDKEKKHGIFKFYGKHWDNDVDKENGNYDYLMGCDIDFNNVDVSDELVKWGKWYLDTTNIDEFRLDAVKHIRADFLEKWLKTLRSQTGKDLTAVGEYWTTNLMSLQNYIKETNGVMRLFDVPLHYNFFNASNSGGNFDMRTILDNSLVKANPDMAVTFVDNHDTQPGQSLCSWVQDWFKPLAYAIILLRKFGLPCIFYGDYYGVPSHNEKPFMDILDKLLWLRKEKAFGSQNDYFDDFDVVGWTREGDDEHIGTGLAVLITDKRGGVKKMYIGKRHAGKIFYDCIGNCADTVTIDKEGYGVFEVSDGSVSVWILKNE